MRNNANPVRRRQARERLRVPPKAMAMWSLDKVITDGMAPLGEYSPSTLANYRYAVREFRRFIGYEQSPVNVSEAKFAAFRKFLISEKLSQATIDLQTDCLAAVVRFTDPALLPSRQRPERKAFADAETPGTVEYFMVNEYFPVSESIQSAETKRQYAMAAARFSRFVGHPATLADLTDENLTAWMESVRSEGKQLKTINNYMNNLRAFWSWAAKRGMVATAPSVKNLAGRDAPKSKRQKPAKSNRTPPVNRRTAAAEKGERDVLAPGGVLWFANRYLKARDVTPMYAKRLRKSAVKLARFVGAATLLDAFTEDNINEFLSQYEGSPYTVRSYRSDFITLWNGAADEDLLPYPRLRRIKRPKCHELIIDCYTVGEVRRLLDAAMKLKGEYSNGVPKRDYWDAAIRLAWDTGLRRGDVIAFNKSGIKSDGRARVIQRKTKKIVPVALRESTIAALDRIPANEPLAWPMDANYFSRHFRRLVRMSNVAKGSFKWLRRSSGTYVEMQLPGAGTKHLGHASPEVFNRHYDGHLADPVLPMPPALDDNL